jgi:hypothetical protein
LATEHYFTTEEIKDEKGNVLGHKQVEKELVREPIREYDLEKCGWFKKFVWRVLTKKTVWKPIAESNSFERTTDYVIQYLLFDADKMPCHCNGSSEFVFLRKMPSGVFKTCAKCSRTSGSMATDTKFGDKSIKKLSEKIVTIEQAIRLFREGKIDFLDASLSAELGLPTYGVESV